MEKKHRDVLQSNHLLLISQLDFVNSKILDYLYTDGILQINDVEEIECKVTSNKKASYFLLSILTKRGPKAFEKFLRSLVKLGSNELAKILDPDLTLKLENEVEVPKHGIEKNVLRDNHVFLIESLDFENTCLQDVLVEKKLLSLEAVERLEAEKVPLRKARLFLLKMLPFRGPKAFGLFLEALRETEEQAFIAEELDRYLSAPDQIDVGHKRFKSDEEIAKELDDVSVSAFQSIQSVTKDFVDRMKQDAYPMSRAIRGHALIINNQYFLAGKQRTGASRDLEALTKLFESLHFKVISYSNLASKEIEDIVEGESQFDHSKHDAFVLFILTHGENGYVLGSDDEKVSIDKIVDTIGHIGQLNDKPKMFFIQACRPDSNVPDPTKDDTWKTMGIAKPPTKVTYDASAGNQQVKEMAKNRPDAEPTGLRSSLVNHRDIFIASSTLPGFLSWRNIDAGSWFVRYFVYVCSTRAHEEDLTGILLAVNRLLKLRPQVHEQIGESVIKGISKKIFFFPNYTSPDFA